MEFPSLSWLSDSPESALKGIREVVSGSVRDMGSNREEIPRALVIQAAEAGVSLKIVPN